MNKKIWYGLFGLFGLLFLVGCAGVEIPEQFCIKHNGIEAKVVNGTIKIPPAMYEVSKGACPTECPVGFNCIDTSKISDEAIIEEAYLRISNQHYVCINVPPGGYTATHIAKEICDEVGGKWVLEGSAEERIYTMNQFENFDEKGEYVGKGK